MDEAVTIELEEIVRARLADWPAQWEGYHWPGYTWEHTLRVRNLAVRLAREVGADPEIVSLAALLHDIDKPVGSDHAAVGAETARELLEERDLPEAIVAPVVSAIATHAGDNTPDGPLENLALGDADLIDANFGLVGTWRFITIRAGRGSDVEGTVEGFWPWLRKKEEMVHRLLLPAARDLALERVAHSRVFCTLADRALQNGSDCAILQLLRHINAEHTRGSLSEQLPDLRLLARQAEDEAALATCRRLDDEAAGRA